MAPHDSRALLLALSSPPAVLTLCGGCALFTAWFPLPSGECASGLRCLRPRFAVESAVSADLRGWSSSSGLCWSFTCSCGGVVWSQACGPSCCSCVLCLCCAVLSPWALARPTLSGLRLRIPMVSWSKLLVFSWPLYWSSFLLLPVVTVGSGWLLPALRAGSPTYGCRCVLRHALVLVAVPPSLRSALHLRTGFLFSGPGVSEGFPSFLLCFPSGCGHPLGQ